MEHLITLKLILVFFLFVLSGIFSCSEAALFSLSPLHLHKMQEERFPFITYLKDLLGSPKRLLITLIVGNEIVNISFSILVASLFVHLLGMEGLWIAIAVSTVLLLIFGEAVPKTVAVTHPTLFAFVAVPFVSLVSKILHPIAWILDVLSSRLVSLIPGNHASEKAALTEGEFRTLVDASEKGGAIEASQRDLIHRVFELGDKPVSEVMIPRVDMFCLPATMRIEDIEREVIKARHGRIPIYGSDRDDIIGILFAMDLLKRVAEGGSTAIQIEKILRKAYFVPEERSASEVLRDFQIRNIQIAIVVDEYGGVSGLVTMEDILEYLFKGVFIETGSKDGLWQRIDDHTWFMSGKLGIDEFCSLTGASIPEEEFDTIGGYVFHLFGKLPFKGDIINSDGFIFKVEKISGARIMSLMVEKDRKAI